MRLWKILLALLLVLTGSGPSALASIPLAPKNPCTGHFRGVVSGHRYYNPTLGRWLGRDSAGEKSAVCLFLFCHNNPLVRVDGDGREDTIEVTFSLNAASSLNAAYSGSTLFIADGLAQLAGTLGAAADTAIGYASAYTESASLLLTGGKSAEAIYFVASAALGYNLSGYGGSSIGDENGFTAGDLLSSILDEDENRNAVEGATDAFIDSVSSPSSP